MEHVPVMAKETLEGLVIRPSGFYWDGTFGRGGHSRLILQQLDEEGRLLASDRDEAAEREAAHLTDPRFRFVRGSLEEVLETITEPLTGFFWDLGTSTPQLREAERGFSFSENGPLDMRMDRRFPPTAADLVNDTPEHELADLIYNYGEERLSRRIARRIVAMRAKHPIEDTATLAEICRASYPRKRHHRIDPATRTFQALRIAVNDELGQLERTLPRALEHLAPGGRATVISFHSLEDRIVKHCFRDHASRGYKILTKKPLTPSDGERYENPASRSAKLRVLAREEGEPS